MWLHDAASYPAVVEVAACEGCLTGGARREDLPCKRAGLEEIASTVMEHTNLTESISRPQPVGEPREQTEAALRKLTHQLEGRVKELDCLFGLSDVVERSRGSLDTVLKETVDLLPAAWEYPDVACARIVLDGSEYRSARYRDSIWKQEADVFVHGRKAGVVEVRYFEERPSLDEGPFLAEERRLINTIAAKLGRIAERQHAERALRDQERELRERMTHMSRVSTVGEMASNIAHEVNQPLTAISAYAQAGRRLLEAGAGDQAEIDAILMRIGQEALRAGDIIRHLQDLVRKRGTKREPSDVNALIRDIEHLASVDCRLRDVRLQLVLAPSLPTVLADGVQLQQVVLNLIRNAVDAVEMVEPEHKEVTVCTARHDSMGEVEVSVIDRGCGIQERVGDGLFEPFFTTKTGGLGMGLSISRSIVQSHGGSLWFTRNPDRGTTFSFSIPVSSHDYDVAS
jgi:C4-dicarboxylate-specific signal transduction histidine kinase